DGWFEIDANNGQISLSAAGALAAANDYESLANTHVLTVTASDGANTTPIQVTLNERDLNDNAPVFEDPASPGTPVASYAFDYDENSLETAVLCTVLASDVDSPPSFPARPSSDPDGWFEIDANNGQISL